MSIQEQLKKLKDDKSYSIPAKRVMERLKSILSKSNDLKKRWMWELLQNASDLGEEIITEFEISKDNLVFRHNGNLFSLDEAYNLIMPDSNKDDESARKGSKIGQFGTGFISTHILSKIVNIKGVVNYSDEDDSKKGYYSFSFELDRSERTDKEFLIESIKKSDKQYGESLTDFKDYERTEFDTEFEYSFKDTYSDIDGDEVISEGIDSFKELIPFVFTFRPQLKKINVIDYRSDITERWVFSRSELETEIDDLKLVQTICEKDGQRHSEVTVGTVTCNETTVALKIEKIEGNEYKILEFPEYSPKIYCAFPMIGTTEFNFPIVIHSEGFVPNDERDGISISKHDLENRTRLIEAKDATLKLIEIIEKYKWTDAYNICDLKKVEYRDEETLEWYRKAIFTPIGEKILESQLIELDDDLEHETKRNSLSNVYIPYSDKREADHVKKTNELYDLAFAVFPELIPKKEHLLCWYSILDFDVFQKEKLDLEKLVKKISEDAVSYTDFETKFSMKEHDINTFLKNLISLVIKNGQQELLNIYAIVPNQNQNLNFQKKLHLNCINHKHLNEGYDEKLIELYKNMSDVDCNEILLHKDFESIESLLEDDNKLHFGELARKTDDEFKDYDGSYQNESFLVNLKEMFKWYNECGISEEAMEDFMPYFSASKPQLYMKTKTAEELQYAFDIDISGKGEVLSRIAKTNLKNNELEVIASNPEMVISFINWLNNKQQDNPDEELGEIGEEYLNYELNKMFGEDRVKWEKKSEYDFRILESDLNSTKYYIDAKTTANGISNTENVPFYMRSRQWEFLEKEMAVNKYYIARVYKNAQTFKVKFLQTNLKSLDS